MNWRGPLGRAGGRLLQVVRSGLFYPRCRICGLVLVDAAETVICRECRDTIRPCGESQCRTCGAFVPEGVEACGSCLLEPPPFARHVSYAAYEGTLREVILLYKYGEAEPLRHLLARLYLEAMEKKLPGISFDVLAPVPADSGRRRGFHPVQAAGKPLARKLGIPFRPGLLVKKKNTPPQVGLTRARRLTNLSGAFALGRGEKVDGRSVLLIDDVSTTGATLRACAAVLRRGGARVTALTLAQSRPDFF